MIYKPIIVLMIFAFSHKLYAECLHIGDSQSFGSAFQKSLSSTLKSKGYSTQSYARVGATTLDWSRVPATDPNGTFFVKAFPSEGAKIPEKGNSRSWLSQILDQRVKDNNVNCVLIQLGDNDFSYARKYLELMKKNPIEAKKVKDTYIKQVKNLISQVEEFNDDISLCRMTGPTFKDRAGSYPLITNEIKALINEFQKEALAGSRCEHINGTDPLMKAELDKLKDYTSDGLHLKSAAGTKWGEFVAYSMVGRQIVDRQVNQYREPSEVNNYQNKKKDVVKRFSKDTIKNIDVRDYILPIHNSIKVMSTDTGKEITLNAKKNMKIQVLGKAPWGYKVRVFADNILLPGEFITATSNVKNGVNWFMLEEFEQVDRSLRDQTEIDVSCKEDATREYGVADLQPLVEEQANPPISAENYKEGCHVLEKAHLSQEDRVSLKKCISSIQAAIILGNRKSNGSLDRKKVFDSMFTRLNPREQKFAAMIFTAQGEVGWLANNGREHEMVAVMKVLQNRVEMAKKRNWNAPYNELDIALYPNEFSMYNPNESNWKRVIDPVHRTTFDKAIEAFMRLPVAQFRPPEEADKISHYHTNYVSPSWRNSPVVDLVVDGKPVVGANNTRHIFYRNVDGNVGWSRRQNRGWKRP